MALSRVTTTSQKVTFGYKLSNGQKRNVDNVCVLIVSYKFEDNPVLIRDGNDWDSKNLEKSFASNRGCRYFHLERPTKRELLHLLSSQEALFDLFKITNVPSVFIVFILSHGGENGSIDTDYVVNHEYVTFTTKEVVDSIKKLEKWQNCLKINVFGCCRGNLRDALHGAEGDLEKFKNSNSCQLKNFPEAENFVLIYSTVETTTSTRDPQHGTSLVEAICYTLDNLPEDTALENFFARVQKRVRDRVTNGCQTPEGKFMAHEKIFIHKASHTGCSSKNEDARYVNTSINMIEGNRYYFYPWTSDKLEATRRKLAFVFGSGINANGVENALRSNLEFETYIYSNAMDNLKEVYEKTKQKQSSFGCILLCFFAKLFLLPNNEEIRVLIGDTNGIRISEIVYNFIGPHNPMWIGRPKIFFFVHESLEVDNNDVQHFEFKATNHSGVFVCILKTIGSAGMLISLLNDRRLRNGATLQELSHDMIQKLNPFSAGEVLSQILSTLPYQLDFPIWPRVFIEPYFNLFVRNSKNHGGIGRQAIQSSLRFLENRSFGLSKLNINYEKLKKQIRKQLLDSGSHNYCVWIFSSLPGSGKSTVLKDLQCFLTREQALKKVFLVNVLQQFSYLNETNSPDVYEVLKNAQDFNQDLEKFVQEKRTIVFLDGFDEICPHQRTKALKLIESIARLKLPLVIATRPHEEDSIMNKLKEVSTIKVEIVPFEKESQIQLMQQVSGKNSEECLNIWMGFRNKESSDILTNPFHATLISENLKMNNQESELNLFSIYEKVIETKIREALINKEQKLEGSKFPTKIKERLELLQSISHHFLLAKRYAKWTWTDKQIEKINNSGIVQISDMSVNFVHQTFAEFLLAQKFVFEIKKDGFSKIPVLYDPTLRQCRFFVDVYLAECNEEFAENVFRLAKEKVLDILQYVTEENLKQVFKLIQPTITFSNADSGLTYIEEAFPYLLAACKSSEEIGIELIKMGALRKVEDSEKLCELVENIASRNFRFLFSEMKSKCANILKTSKTTSCLINAARSGSIEMVKLLVEIGVDVELTDSEKFTALHWGIASRKTEVLQILIEMGKANIKATEKDGANCLLIAAKFGNLEAVKYLVNKDETLLKQKTNHGFNSLHMAVTNSDPEICRYLIGKGCPLQDELIEVYEWNALHLACALGTVQHVQYLLGLEKDKEVDKVQRQRIINQINVRTNFKSTSLILAAQFSHVEMCQFLVINGADIHAVDNDENNVLHHACRKGNLDTAQYILGLDVLEVDVKGKNGKTALHFAASNGHIELVQFLLSNGADINSRNKNNKTPLILAAKHSTIKVYNFLVEKGADLSATDKNGHTASHFLGYDKSLDSLTYWLGLGDFFVSVNDQYDGRKALHHAVFLGNFEAVEFLLSRGADVNVRDENNFTPLILAAENSDVEMCRFLVQNGADLNAADIQGRDALHHACLRGHLDNVEYFLGLNRFIAGNMDTNGRTPLHLAVFKGHAEIVEYLLSKGQADINACDNKECTPLMIAAQCSTAEMCQVLIENRANVSAVDEKGLDALQLACLMGKLDTVRYLLDLEGFNVEKRGPFGITALHLSCMKGHKDLAEFLMSKGLNINIRDQYRNTPLLTAATRSTVEICRFLVSKGADLNAVNNDGNGVLHQACLHGNVDIADYLVSLKNLDCKQKNHKGETACEIAKIMGHKDIVKILCPT